MDLVEEAALREVLLHDGVPSPQVAVDIEQGDGWEFVSMSGQDFLVVRTEVKPGHDLLGLRSVEVLDVIPGGIEQLVFAGDPFHDSHRHLHG